MSLKRVFLFAPLVAAFSFLSCGNYAQAGVIELQFSGLEISYDGSTITDGGTGADPLTSVVILEDNTVTGGSPFVSDIAIDIVIPGVSGISAAGDQVLSDPGGSLTLSLPGGDFVALSLEEVIVTYVDGSDPSFVFGATVAEVLAQSLPAGLVMNNPVSVSFSTTIDTLTVDAGVVETFTASGTGEIRDVIPEPTTVALVLVGAFATLGARRGS